MNETNDSAGQPSAAIKAMIVLWLIATLILVALPSFTRVGSAYAVAILGFFIGLPCVSLGLTLARFRRLGVWMRIIGLLPAAVVLPIFIVECLRR